MHFSQTFHAREINCWFIVKCKKSGPRDNIGVQLVYIGSTTTMFKHIRRTFRIDSNLGTFLKLLIYINSYKF